ncbi:MAG: hypothetical protein AAFX01_08095 [Cyanobacteria bacterium J06638_28]
MKVFSIAILSIMGGLLALPAHSEVAGLHPGQTAKTNLLTANDSPMLLADAIAPPQTLTPGVMDEFFLPWQVGEANFYQTMVTNAYSSPTEPANTQTEEFYLLALRLTEKLLVNTYESGWEQEEQVFQFKDTDLGLWGLDASCQAECTVPALRLNVDEFLAIATQTATTADDDFFQLIDNYYSYAPAVNDGELWGAPAYFQFTWDYGGYSLLGEGQHLQLLQQMDQYMQNHEAYTLQSYTATFVTQVQQMRHQLLRDLLLVSDCSGPSREAIVNELEQILTQVRLNPTERNAIAQRLQAFQELPDTDLNNSVSPTSAIQVGCETFGQCTCEGG